MIRLLLVTPFGSHSGGSDELLLSFLGRLDHSRFEPLVVLLEPGSLEAEIQALRVPTIALRGGRLRNPVHVARTSFAIARLIRHHDPALVLSWLSTAHVYAGPAALAVGRKDTCLWWQHDLHGGRSLKGVPMRDRVGAYRGRALDAIATMIPATAIGCISRAVAEEQSRRRPRRRTFVVLNGIEEPQAIPADDVIALRERLGVPRDAVLVGTVGRLFAWKGHHLLLHALAGARERGLPVFGIFVGGGGRRPNGRYEAYLDRLVDGLGLRPCVSLAGHVDQPAPYIRAMDVFVSASSPEPFGLALLEAMAHERPVVAFNHGGPAEIIVNGESGLLVESNDVVRLQDEIENLVINPDLRLRLGRAARRHYLARFTAERMTREIERELASLA